MSKIYESFSHRYGLLNNHGDSINNTMSSDNLPELGRVPKFIVAAEKSAREELPITKLKADLMRLSIRSVDACSRDALSVEVSMGTNCWNRRLSLENSVKWCEQLTLVGDIVLERRRRLILTKSSEAAACAQEFLSFLEVALSSKLFFADRAFGLAICKLLDNRLQSLQMSYELLHLRTEGSKSLNQDPAESSNGTVRLKPSIFPTQAHEKNRDAVHGILYWICQRVLGARCFKHGSTLYGTYLEDEPQRLSICMNTGQGGEPWFSVLCSFLCRLSVDESRALALSELGNHQAGGRISVTKVEFYPHSERLFCVVNGMKVLLSANNRRSLCQVAFFEEICSVKNQANAFRQVVRALRAVLRKSHYLPKGVPGWIFFEKVDDLLLPLVLHYFLNLLDETSGTGPLQIAANIMGYYASFDWMEKMVLPFRVGAEDVSVAGFTPVAYLEAFLRSIQSFSIRSRAGESEIMHLLQLLERHGQRYQHSRRNQLPHESPKKFLPSPFGNIADVLDLSTNLVDESRSEAMRFLVSECRRLGSEKPPVISIAGMEPTSGSDSFVLFPLGVVDLAALASVLGYMDLVLYSVIQLESLLELMEEILFQNSSLPIGEIGKILQSRTGNPSVTVSLKEHFGGLKKFIEHHKEVFYIAKDHPYNPSVYLKRFLSQQDLSELDRGIAPTHYTSLFQGSKSFGSSSDRSSGFASSASSQKRTKKKRRNKISHENNDAFHRTHSELGLHGTVYPQQGTHSRHKGSQSMADLSSVTLEPATEGWHFDLHRTGRSDSMSAHSFPSPQKPGYGSSTTISSLLYDRSMSDDAASQDNFF